MGIQIAVATERPAVVFNLVHVTNLAITQKVFSDNTLTPVYQVEINYRLYGVGSDDTRYYEDADPKTLVIPDYIPVAMAEAAEGDTTLISALQGIEAAVAAILTNQAGMPSTTT